MNETSHIAHTHTYSQFLMMMMRVSMKLKSVGLWALKEGSKKSRLSCSSKSLRNSQISMRDNLSGKEINLWKIIPFLYHKTLNESLYHGNVLRTWKYVENLTHNLWEKQIFRESESNSSKLNEKCFRVSLKVLFSSSSSHGILLMAKF